MQPFLQEFHSYRFLGLGGADQQGSTLKFRVREKGKDGVTVVCLCQWAGEDCFVALLLYWPTLDLR